ncbi:uncharacterized protein LOC18425753 isoform X2 [Amborella trichopoda]|uniref:uncharacterized protein LOC18425753 isoform X2 n=1 Tax=Amborella trichopoda TaxID=13333 RepID=UPI0009BFD803|nr:uncharacterized protein LOC18425753 isoform X2 [Amborella trichopoda]|eukprot:XP_020517836.1 uncharacterized protein LOC18425753 isoform X2 [Amborella trichopoda]
MFLAKSSGLYKNGSTNRIEIFGKSEMWQGLSMRYPCLPCMKNSWHVSYTAFALGSGVEGSIADSDDLNLGDINVVVESRDGDRIHIRVDLMGEQTQKAFDDVLTDLARTAPPIPGFRRKKGGKTSNVPKSFLLQILGRDRVTKFTIQEIVSSSVADYVKKENLKAKNKFNTKQTAEELEESFSPGNGFGFNATIALELDNPDSNPDQSS